MIGARVPDGEFSKLVCTRKLYGGEYGRVNRDGEWVWMCCTPNGHFGDLSAHEVTEHEDGTISVEPSILVTLTLHDAPSEGWHGYLRRGVWTEA